MAPFLREFLNALPIWLNTIGGFAKPDEFRLFYNATQMRPKETGCCYLRLSASRVNLSAGENGIQALLQKCEIV